MAEALCIVADTDRMSVQVVTSQRRVCEAGRLGRDVMVSNLVHTLITSVLQLYALNITSDFVSRLGRHKKSILYLQCSVKSMYFYLHSKFGISKINDFSFNILQYSFFFFYCIGIIHLAFQEHSY